MDNLYALIMAGGGGTRLWPLSRKDRPKQMLPLVEDQTMFRISVERLDPLIPPERIFIVTGQNQVDQLKADAPNIPAENFIVEPFGQNTGPAVGLAVLHIQQREPDAMIAILAADHHIADKDKFRRVLLTAAQQAQEGYIVTLGISPAFPATGYGYIKRGEPLHQIGEFQVYDAEQFTEKPDLETATEFLLSGLYSWNSGMFICEAEFLMGEYARQQERMYALLQQIKGSTGTDSYETVLAEAWPQMPSLSLDYAVMEGAAHMAVIPVDMGWSDIGSWATLYGVLNRNGSGNVVRAEQYIGVDTTDSLIVSERLVATIGLDNIVIIDTEDALLVCPRDRSQDVRQIVDQLKASGSEKHL